MIQVVEDFCNDAHFDTEGHITKEFARCIDRAEEEAFITDDGVDAPGGFMNDAVVGHSTGDITYDDVIRLFFSLDKEYRRNAVWIMNDETALKLRYRLSIQKQYRDEIIASFEKVRPLLEQLFMLIGEQALISNEFSMENESRDYFSKLAFYEKRIESLVQRKKIIEEKCHGKYDIKLKLTVSISTCE